MICNTRILIFAHDSSLYGASLSLLTLLEYLVKDERFEIMILLPYAGIIETNFEELNINYKIINYPHCIVRKEKTDIVSRIVEIIKYKRNFNKVKPELKHIVTSFKPDVIYSNTSIVSIGYILSKYFKIPHIWHIREFGFGGYNFNYLPNRYFHNKLINKSDIIIYITNELKKYWSVEKRNEHVVIYNGIVHPEIDKPQPRKLSKNIIVFGILGVILEGKGQHIAINAFSKLIKSNPNCFLEIFGDIGDNTYYNEIQNLITQLKCESNIKIFSFTDNKKVYPKIDVLLSCSRMEGMGRTIIEAMSFGIPVISNASGGPLEIITNNETGLFYNSSIEHLTEQMQLLTNNNLLYEKISKQSIDLAFSKFTTDAYADQMVEVFLNFKKND